MKRTLLFMCTYFCTHSAYILHTRYMHTHTNYLQEDTCSCNFCKQGVGSPSQLSRCSSMEPTTPKGDNSVQGKKRSVFESLRALTRHLSKNEGVESPRHKKEDSGSNWSMNSNKNERSKISTIPTTAAAVAATNNNNNNNNGKNSRTYQNNNGSSSSVNEEESKTRGEGSVCSPSMSRYSLTDTERGVRSNSNSSAPPPPPFYDDLITELSLPSSSTTSQYQAPTPIFLHIDSTLLAIARLRHASFQVRTEIQRIQEAQANLVAVKAHREQRRKENMLLMETRQEEEWKKALEEDEQQLLGWSESLHAEDDKLTRTLQEIYADRTERDRILDQTAASLAQDKAEVAMVSEQLRQAQRDLDARNDECERLERLLNGE